MSVRFDSYVYTVVYPASFDGDVISSLLVLQSDNCLLSDYLSVVDPYLSKC